jgi:hypothetical protein
MKNQPLFYICSRQRGSKYATETYFWNAGGASVEVEKRALSELGIQHLHGMPETAKQLGAQPAFSSKVAVLAPTKTPRGIRYPFVEGKNLEAVLLESMLGSTGNTTSVLDEIFSIIDSLSTTKVNPTDSEEYQKYFGHTFAKIQPCAAPGLFDLNLDNFIIDEKTGKWVLIDYEWCFDFPLPATLLKFRVLWHFLQRHKETINYNRLKLEPYLFDGTVFVPKIIHSKYKKLFEAYNEFTRAESGFQKEVSGDFARTLDVGSAQFEEVGLNKPVGYELVLKQAIDSKTALLKAEFAQAKSKLRDTSKELEMIKTSRSYRFSTRIARMLRAIR